MHTLSSNPRAASASLNGLPLELQNIVVNHVCDDTAFPSWNTRSWDSEPAVVTALIPLSSVSRHWRDLLLPYVFRKVDLRTRSNAGLFIFATAIAPKYGQHCRWLSFSLRTSDEENEKAEFMDLSWHEKREYEEQSAATSGTWHSRRSTLLSLTVHYMPKIEHLKISTCECRWHHSEDVPCQCLNAYDNLLAVLRLSHLGFLHFDFGYTRFTGDGSDKFASILLRKNSETLRIVHLMAVKVHL